MTTALVVAACVTGAMTGLSGWFVLRAARASLSASALMAAGGVVIAAVVARQMGVEGGGAALVTVLVVLGAWAVVLYPTPAWGSTWTYVALGAVGGFVVMPRWFAEADLAYSAIGAGLIVGAHLWFRIETRPEERRALLWCATGWGVAFVAVLGLVFLFQFAAADGSVAYRVANLAEVLAAAFGPLGMVVGAARPDLVDVRGLITHAFVLALVLLLYIAVLVGPFSWIEDLTGQRVNPGVVAVAAGLLAFAVPPFVRALRGVFDQVLFGERPEPLRAALDAVERIGDDPLLALQAVRDALGLPYAVLTVGGAEVAVTGAEVPHVRRLALTFDGQPGELVVGLRPGDLTLPEDDEAVLRIVAPLLAQTLAAQRLAEEAAESRGAVVTAVEEERRRLRRELHDGIGPTLSGVAFAMDAARNLVDTQPEEARILLGDIRANVSGAIAEVRRLVDGLRPANLDELGLIGSIRQFAHGLRSAGGRAVDIEIVVDGALPELSAAVEVAAYRIAVEALTNVARHAEANSAKVLLGVAGQDFTIAITDDGAAAGEWTMGTGLSSMRERVDQLLGSFSAGRGPGGGVVTAHIPL